MSISSLFSNKFFPKTLTLGALCAAFGLSFFAGARRSASYEREVRQAERRGDLDYRFLRASDPELFLVLTQLDQGLASRGPERFENSQGFFDRNELRLLPVNTKRAMRTLIRRSVGNRVPVSAGWVSDADVNALILRAKRSRFDREELLKSYAADRARDLSPAQVTRLAKATGWASDRDEMILSYAKTQRRKLSLCDLNELSQHVRWSNQDEFNDIRPGQVCS